MGLRPPVNGSSFAPVPLDWGFKTGVSNHLTELYCGPIFACDHFENFMVLAGHNLVIVDVAAKKVFMSKSVESAIERIKSAQFCKVPDRLLLALGGRDADYSGTNTDLFDATPLTKRVHAESGQSLQVAHCAYSDQLHF